MLLCVQSVFSACDSAPFFRRSHLDYLSLDFNSASPSPVQKVSRRITSRQGGEELCKAENSKTFEVLTFLRYFLSQKPLLDEQRVDYVQVDEKKTQALQNTRTEWKDSRQPKV